MNRHQILAGRGAAGFRSPNHGAALAAADRLELNFPATDPYEGKALIAMTFDLEMSMHYPTWDQVEWNYEKGLLNDAAKDYTLKAARRVKAAGGVMHDFVVGRVFEEENVDFLKDLIREGNQLGNHTYDHVYILATRPEDVQYRFQRARWLVYGRTPSEVIVENIRMCERAMKHRLGIYPNGFRAPGGFRSGIDNRPDIQLMLISVGYEWASTKHLALQPGDPPTQETFATIVNAQKLAQQYVHPSGLVEVPMGPVDDVDAMRSARWKLSDFHKALGMGLQWVIDNGAVFDMLCHPSVIGIEDPGFETIDFVLDIVKRAGDRAVIVSPDVLAQRAIRQARAHT